jgi:hypothetical protein
MGNGPEPADETYSPWTVVNVVFTHLAEHGMHPVLGGSGPPAEPAAELLCRLGITPMKGGDSRTTQRVRDELAQMRASLPERPPATKRPVSQ